MEATPKVGRRQALRGQPDVTFAELLEPVARGLQALLRTVPER